MNAELLADWTGCATSALLRSGPPGNAKRIGKERSWGLLIVAAIVVAALGAYVVEVVLEARQQTVSELASGVEDVDVGSAALDVVLYPHRREGSMRATLQSAWLNSH